MIALGILASVAGIGFFCWLLVTLAFAAPAAFTGYHAVHGIAAAAMPPTVWQQILSCAGAALIGATAWSRVAATPPRSPYPSAG